MKHYEKIAIFMLCIAVITTILSVSVCAEDTYEISGIWQMNETVDVSTKWTENVNLSLTSFNNTRYYGLTVYSIGAYEDVPAFGFVKEDGTKTYFAQSKGKLTDERGRTIDFGIYSQTVSSTFYNWFTANATYVSDSTTSFVCDGSTCPATDINYDFYCDDCGMMLSYSVRSYPPIDSIWDKNTYPYGVLMQGNDGIVSVYFLSNQPTSSDGVDFRLENGTFSIYKLTDGEWVHDRDGRGAIDFHDLDSGNILKVSDNVEYNGTVIMPNDPNFFPPPPLAEVIQGVAMEELQTETLPKMGGTMKILVACGVGLMACLVVLKLFGKRSLIFRN